MMYYTSLSSRVMSMTARARNYLSEFNIGPAKVQIRRAKEIINSYEECAEYPKDTKGIRRHLERVEIELKRMESVLK